MYECLYLFFVHSSLLQVLNRDGVLKNKLKVSEGYMCRLSAFQLFFFVRLEQADIAIIYLQKVFWHFLDCSLSVESCLTILMATIAKV